MSNISLADLSNQFADAVAVAAQSVVQVHGRRQPASGVVYAPDVIVTTTRAIGSEDGLSVRTPDGRTIDAELIGWDPATHVVALRAAGLDAPAAVVTASPVRVGHLAIGVARSWSNNVTASAGIISVIGGPLPTGHGRHIDEIIRTNAPMHRGFAGGAFVDTSGALVGLTTSAEIRGLGVVIPASIVWKAADALVQHGRTRRGYLGVAGQVVQLAAAQRPKDGPSTAVLVVRVMEESPAERAGILVGDILTGIDTVRLNSPDDLLAGLAGRGGQTVNLQVLRGGAEIAVSVQIGER